MILIVPNGGCQTGGTNKSGGGQTAVDPFVPKEPYTALRVKGIGCPFCIPNIERPLKKIPGVGRIGVDLETGKVLVELSLAQRPTEIHLRDSIKQSGFTLEKVEMPK